MAFFINLYNALTIHGHIEYVAKLLLNSEERVAVTRFVSPRGASALLRPDISLCILQKKMHIAI